MANNSDIFFMGAPANLSPAEISQHVGQRNLLNLQGQQQGYQLRQLAQAEADDQSMREAFRSNVGADGTLNRAGTLKDLTQTNPMAGMKIQHQWALDDAATAKAQREARKAQLESISKEADEMARVAGSIVDQPSYLRGLQWAKDKGMDVAGWPSEYDPGLVRQTAAFALTAKDRADQEWKALEATRKASEPTSEAGKLERDIAKGQVPADQAPAYRRKAQYIAPPMTFGMGGGGSNFDPSKPLSPAMESEAKARSKTGERLTPSARNPYALPINARSDYLAQQDGADMGERKIQFKTQGEALKFFTTGKGADAFRQQETILHHAKVFDQIADAMNNGDMQLANRLGNQVGIQLGSDKATNYRMAGQIFSAEVGKYLAGSQSTEAERVEMAKLMPMFSSPQQIKGALMTLSNLVQGQRNSWMKQREAALSGRAPDANPGHGQAAPRISSPSDPAFQALPSGSRFIGPDGVERVKR